MNKKSCGWVHLKNFAVDPVWKILRELNFAYGQNSSFSQELNFADDPKTAKSAKFSSFKVNLAHIKIKEVICSKNLTKHNLSHFQIYAYKKACDMP